jgi:hypothetical protein
MAGDELAYRMYTFSHHSSFLLEIIEQSHSECIIVKLYTF